MHNWCNFHKKPVTKSRLMLEFCLFSVIMILQTNTMKYLKGYKLLLSRLGEKQKEREKLERQGSISSNASSRSTGTCNSSVTGSTVAQKHDETWIHEIFEGTLTNETRCLSCETVSVR